MTERELEEMRGRARWATPGPWWWDAAAIDPAGHPKHCLVGDENEAVLEATGLGFATVSILDEDADFIAHARADIPRLLEEIERLRKLVGEGND